MKRILSLTLSLALLTLVFSSVMARPANDGQRLYPVQANLLPPVQGADMAATRADTLFLFEESGGLGSAFGDPGTDGRGFTFDTVGGSSDCGWVPFDKTAQPATYWHAETALVSGEGTDMSAVTPFGGGDNTYAMHCGRWGVCGWTSEDGYGNNWDQHLRAECGDFTTSAQIEFAYIADFEGDVWDYFQVFIQTYTDGVLTLEEIYSNQISGETTLLAIDLTVLVDDFDVDSYGDFVLRFSSDGAWSDEDGLFISDVGACWADNFIVTRDAVELWRDDIEDGVIPAELHPEFPAGAGSDAALYNNLYTQDVCSLNQSYCWAYFDLATTNPAYPINVIQNFPYLDNDVQSPLLTMSHEADNPSGVPMSMGPDTSVNLKFLTYRDMPSDALIYYSWSLAAYTPELGCVGVWKNDNTVYYGDDKQWGIHSVESDATLAVLESAQGGTVEGIKIALNCVDMCPFWCDTQGSGENHTPGPFIDNVRLALVETSSVAWNIGPWHFLQDTFPNESDDGQGGAAGKNRIDPVNNIEPIASPTVVHGDSAMVELNMDGHGGIKETFSTAAGEIRPEFWMYFQVVSGPHAGMLNASMGDADNSDGVFTPYEGTVADVIGTEPPWGIVRADYGRTQGNIQPGKYAFDLADNYFEGGDVIHYFFKGVADDDFTENLPEWAQSTSLDLRGRYIVRCLPTDGSQLLFCDDWNGSHFWWSEAFAYNGYAGYDTYTTGAPSSGQENGLAGHATEDDLAQYYCIVWDSGNLSDYAVTSIGSNDKTEDDALLTNYLANAQHATGLWMFGDLIANDLGGGSAFLANVLGSELLSTTQFYKDVNDIVVPKVFAVEPILSYLGGTPEFWVDGGCPSIEFFSLVGLNAAAPLANVSHEWEVASGSEVAGVRNNDPDGNGTAVNEQGYSNPVVFHPYSYYQVWDAGYAASADQDYARLQVGHVLDLIMNCGANAAPNGVPETPAYTRLEGNFPNPFNPKTAIRFSLAANEHVNLSVYDISGRLVKELVNSSMVSGDHEIIWDGKNNSGSKAASGVYFYKLNAGDFSATDKMVMLK